MSKALYIRLLAKFQFCFTLAFVNQGFAMGAKEEPKLFTSQPSYTVTVYFKDGSTKDLRAIHYNGKPELPNVFLVCRELVASEQSDLPIGPEKKAALAVQPSKRRKTSIKATIAFKNVKQIEFEKFSDTNIKAHITSSRDGSREEYRIPTDMKLKAESDISSVELDLTRIDKIVFTGMGTRKNISTEAEEEARKKKLFRPAIKKSLDKVMSKDKKEELKNQAKEFAQEESVIAAQAEKLLGV